jgi:hypothetical protein
MADPQIVTTLTRKRDEIEATIKAYEKKIAAARRDLASVNATLRLFKLDGEASEFPVYVDTLRLFRRGEIVTLCKAALAKEGPLDTRELALRVIQAKGMDANDAVLRTSLAFRIVQALRLQAKRGTVTALGKRKSICLWEASG